MQRVLIHAAAKDAPLGGMDVVVSAARVRAEAVVGNLVDLQRNDGWVAGQSLSEHQFSTQPAVLSDPRILDAIDDEARLLGVLKFDRFGAGMMPPWRARPGKPLFFLQPGRGQMQHALSSETVAQAMASQEAPANAHALRTPPSLAAAPRLPFGIGEPPWEETSPQALEQALQRRPGDMTVRVTLALARLKRGGAMAEAMSLIQGAPENRRVDERIRESHNWATPAHVMYFAAEPDAAVAYYEKVAGIGTGSESELYARGRLALLKGRLAEAIDATRHRMQRYDSAFVRRDTAGMLFMARQPDAAWQVLLPRAAAGRSLQLWDGAMVGHRIDGSGPAAAADWLRKNGLDQVQVKLEDLRWHYLHLLTVIDRMPDEADVIRLGKGDSPHDPPPRHWAASARLTRAALAGTGEAAATQEVAGMLTQSDVNEIRFMPPLYAWLDWKAKQGKGETLTALRAVGPDGAFDELLAKSKVLALDGRIEESLRSMRAARYDLGGPGLGTGLLDCVVPAPYHDALAGYLMHRHTGHEAYRQETLRFVHAYQKVFPYMGWLYGLEALLDTQPAVRQVAACRARFLDPGSHFLKQAQAAGASIGPCTKAPW